MPGDPGQVLLLVDVLQAQAQLFPRLEKGLAKDHKIGEQGSV